jgi:DNA (cytosine-5)-methyltransferase 1
LFSGIGGLDLAAEMAGIKVIGFCEIEPFPVEVLTKRFPGVPIFEDVRKLTAEVIRDRTGMDASQSIDIIFGGFPCQDLSQAGKQAGLEGARSGLWFEMLRVISELRPRYVLAENVRGAVNLALDTVYSGLVGEGYKVYPYVIPASAVGAPHQRERLFVVGVREDVAHSYRERYIHGESQLNTTEAREYAQRDTATSDTFMENTHSELLQGSGECRETGRETSEGIASNTQFSSGTLWPTPQAVDGSAGGIISPDDTYVQKASGLFRKINRNGVDGSVGLARMVKLWPTPTQRDYKGTSAEEGLIRNDGKSRMDQLPNAVKFWPTPRQFMYKDSTTDRNKGNIGEKVGGQLNPDWVEQLMNFPEGWTDLEVDEPSEWVGWPALLGQEQYPYEFPRTTTGCKARAKRLKALGNAVVPAQAYPFFRAIVEIERVVKEDNK